MHSVKCVVSTDSNRLFTFHFIKIECSQLKPVGRLVSDREVATNRIQNWMGSGYLNALVFWSRGVVWQLLD